MEGQGSELCASERGDWVLGLMIDWVLRDWWLYVSCVVGCGHGLVGCEGIAG